MQTDDPPSVEQLYKRDDPCSQREKLLETELDLLESLKEPMSEVQEDIKKKHV